MHYCQKDDKEVLFQSKTLIPSLGGLKSFCKGMNQDNRIILGHLRQTPRSPIMGIIECSNGVPIKFTLSESKVIDCEFKH